MRHLMSAALALVLASGTSALAQPAESGHHGGQGGQSGGGSHGGQQGGQSGGSHGGGAPSGGAAHGAPAGPAASPMSQGAQRGGGSTGGYTGGARGGGYQGAQGAGQQQHSGGYNGYNGGRGEAQGQGAYRGGERGAAEPSRGAGAAGQAARGAEHGARGVPNTYHPSIGAPGFRPGGERPRYSQQYFPRVFQTDRRYQWRGAGWRPQPGYYYRHWGYGDRLPFGWFDSRWYINDYYYYDLPVPPYGYEWVRVGPDAMLVDLGDGTVVESVYGIFY